jgi:predicted nucleic acid-binding protein
VTYLEFVRGEVKARRNRDTTIAQTLSKFRIEDLTREVALYAGQKALKLDREDMNDLAIAATAVKLRRTLITYNIKHFQGFAGLRVETIDSLNRSNK